MMQCTSSDRLLSSLNCSSGRLTNIVAYGANVRFISQFTACFETTPNAYMTSLTVARFLVSRFCTLLTFHLLLAWSRLVLVLTFVDTAAGRGWNSLQLD